MTDSTKHPQNEKGSDHILKVAFTNTDQLSNKVEEVKMFLKEKHIDLICIGEVLPKRNDHDISSFIIEGYVSYNCLEGRGVSIFVRNDLNITIVELNDVQSLFKPSVFLKIISAKVTFNLGVIYRSPNCSQDQNDNLIIQLNNVAKRFITKGEDMILMGDFNYPQIDWENEACSQAQCNKNASVFLENIHLNNLSQVINQPTHYRAQQTPTLIDLLISNNPSIIKNVCFSPPFGMSHHSVISFDINVHIPPSKKEGVLKLQVDKGNYEEFRQYLHEKDWNGNTEDVDILWGDFFNTMQVGVDKFVPKKVIKPSNAIKRSCPWSPGLLHKVHMKRIAFKNYKKYPSTKNYKIYCKYRNQVKWESRKSLRHKEKK